ncbi:MAG: penicillin-binding protein activator [Sphingomonadales bacterium]|nr:penicillin-binding protein activator [Sphingomonadales bacterium]
MSQIKRAYRAACYGMAVLFIASCGPTSTPQSPYGRYITAPQNLASQGEAANLSARDMANGPIKVALLLPLSGTSANTGKALLDAATLALFQAYDPRIQLLPFDTLGSVDGAKRAASDAIAANVSVILGPLFSNASLEVSTLARDANIPMVSFSNNKEIAGDGVYLLSFMPDEEVNQIISYASAQGYTRFAALIPEGAYGEIVLNSLSQAVAKGGGEITALEVYSPSAEGVFQPVRRLANYAERRQAYVSEKRFLENLGGGMADDILESMEHLETIGEVPFDAVLVPEGGELLRNLVPLLPFFEVDPAKIKFLGTGLWDDRSLIHEPPLKGGWYASSVPENTDVFYKNFKDIFHYTPPRIATLGYDAMSLITMLSRNEIARHRFSTTAFLSPNGFVGVDGMFRFSDHGVSERKLAIVEIQPNGFRTIQPVPDSFEN